MQANIQDDNFIYDSYKYTIINLFDQENSCSYLPIYVKYPFRSGRKLRRKCNLDGMVLGITSSGFVLNLNCK